MDREMDCPIVRQRATIESLSPSRTSECNAWFEGSIQAVNVLVTSFNAIVMRLLPENASNGFFLMSPMPVEVT